MNNRAASNSYVPPSPNLQSLKLTNKSKVRKKNNYPSIQPTQQPQPLHFQSLNKYDKSPKNYYCAYHPQKKAQYRMTFENGDTGLCSVCAITLNSGNGENKIIDNERYQKIQSLQSFQKKATIFKQKLIERETQIYEILSSEQKYYNDSMYNLNQSFEKILADLDEKHKEMTNCLCQCIQKRKKSISYTFSKIEEIKDSIERYIFDIKKNYEEILQELSVQNFRDVMNQYNTKIQYYDNEVLKKIKVNEEIIVYFPINQMQKQIEKASITYYDPLGNHEMFDRQKFNRHERKSQLKIQKKSKRCQTTIKENILPNYNIRKNI